VAGWFCGLSRNKLLITIMILIGIALILDAAIRTFKNREYMPFFLLSIAGFAILVMIYRFKGKDW
jgi:uncharacterized membrane protein (UPF0136 family)